ncbi:hypothetical protein K1240_004516 [Escherichia coli]|nr:hypothetical protein [Escherichia coli]
MNAFLLFVAIFSVIIDLASPLSVYGAQLIIFPLCCILLYINSGAKICYRSVIFVISLITVVFISAFIHVNISTHTEILIYQSLKISIWLFSAMLLYHAALNIMGHIIFKAVSAALVIYVTCLVLQVIFYSLHGTIIDYSTMIGGEPSRNMMSGVGFRPTGFAAEPSVYCGITAWLISLRYAMNKKTDTLFILSCMSMLLTLSFVGAFLCFGILLIGMLRVRMIIPVMGFAFIGYLVLIDRINERVSLFLSGADGSNNVKIDTITNFMANPDIYTYGYGFVGKSISAPPFYESLYDMTIFGNFITIFGLPFGVLCIVLYCVFIIKIKITKRAKLMMLLSSLKISLPFFAVFYMAIAMICAISNKNKALT